MGITLPAHFDGEQIRLDEPFELKPDTKLLVTILADGQLDDGEEWLYLSKGSLAQAYGDREPEYSLEMIRETNPEYEGR